MSRKRKPNARIIPSSIVEPVEPNKQNSVLELEFNRFRCPEFKKKCPHSIVCGPNASTHMISTNQRNKPAIWSSSYPYPVSNVLVSFDDDHAIRLVKRKEIFVTHLNRIKANYAKYKDERVVDRNGSRVVVGTKYIKIFAEMLETDPDKYFNGCCYDWYFTGGSMDSLNYNGQEILLHSEGSELECLKISELLHNQIASANITDTYDRISERLSHGKTIYEIKSTLDQPYFTVRQKEVLSIMDLSTDRLLLDQIHSKIPFVTSAMNSSSQKLISIDAKQHVKLYDLSDLKTPCIEGLIFENEMTVDNWITTRYIEQNLLLCANRKKIDIFDVRQPLFSNPVMRYDLTNTMGLCEDITCVERSTTSHNTFVGTTHKLIALDLRRYNDDNVPMLRWIHQLKTAPIMMDIINKDNSGELIAIAGSKSGDIRICDTATVDKATISSYLPYKPKSIEDSHKQAKSFGKCLNSSSLVLKHIRLSNTGIKLQRVDSKNFVLLTKNSCGDIYTQNIFRKQNDGVDVKIANKIDDWEKALDDVAENKSVFQASDVTNFHATATFIRCNMLKKLRPEKSVNLKTPTWQRSLDELSSYKDLLAKCILQQWDIIESDVVQHNDDVGSSTNRVGHWLQSTVVNATNSNDSINQQTFVGDIEIKTENGIELDVREENLTAPLRKPRPKRISKVGGF